MRRDRIGPTGLFLGFFLIVTALRLAYSTGIPLTADEAYHWVWSRHLAFGYYDHPPLVAWLIAFFTRLGGNSLLWTRLTAGICLAGTTYLTYLLGREIGGERIGAGAGFLSLAATATTLGSVVVSTDSPLILFWIWTAYLVWRAVKTGRGSYWYLAGVTLGFGLQSKFLIVPLVAAIFLFLLFSRDDRCWLRRKEPYLALAIALLIFTPFLIWNARHSWATFAFNLKRHVTEPSLRRPFAYLALQAAILSPWLYAGMVWSLFHLLRRAQGRWREDAGRRRAALFLLLTGWLLPVYFLFQSLRTEVSGHWPVAAYGAALVGLAVALRNRSEERNRPREGAVLGPTFLATGAAWTILVVLLTLKPAWLPVKEIAGHTANEAFGWEELGRKVSALNRRIRPDVIATGSYALSSMISFYTPGHPYLAVMGPGSKHGRAFDLWDQWGGAWIDRSVLFLSDRPLAPSTREWRILAESCARFESLPPIELHDRGKTVRRYYPAVGYGLKKDPYLEARRSYLSWAAEQDS